MSFINGNTWQSSQSVALPGTSRNSDSGLTTSVGASAEILTEFLALRARVAELEKEKEEGRKNLLKELLDKEKTIKALTVENSYWKRKYHSVSQKSQSALSTNDDVPYFRPPTRAELSSIAAHYRLNNPLQSAIPYPAETNDPGPSSSSSTSSENDVVKCKRFFRFLLAISKNQNGRVGEVVKTLIQDLIDNRISPEAFDQRLMKTVNSQPQPHLVGFLKKTMTDFRRALMMGDVFIAGITAPHVSQVSLPHGNQDSTFSIQTIRSGDVPCINLD